jgi:uncharacterized repeat protein (TIGR01451 family)
MLQKRLSSRSLKPKPEVSMRTILIRLCLWCALQPFLLWGTSHSLYAQSSLPSDQLITLTRHVTGFDNPVHITHAGDGSQRLFVVEQEGRIRIVKNQTLLSIPFLDISARVSCCGERGLLSVAFPPNYANKGHFYVNYTNNDGNTVIARYRVTSDPDVANLNSEEILLTIEQPFANHNGGQIAFGPDGYLYIGMGDGGSVGDPQGNGQRPETLLGKLLRIDVESGVTPYAVPTNNPFVQSQFYRGEIWALGLRNPWRFSFDRQTGDLYLGDVGQGSHEEINFQSRASFGGENYGWNIMEGKHCFNSNSCNQTGLVLPIVEYSHSEGCSVTGGVVYRGQQYPRLQGLYFYGDYCSGTIWGLKVTSTAVQQGLLLDSGYSISTFGEDEAGETYVADHGGGTIYRITDPNAPSGADLTLSVTDAPDPVVVNNELTYSATITNNGPSSTAGVQMNISLPAGATFVSVSSSQGSCTGTATVNCQLNTFANGAKATVTLVLKPTATGGLSLTVSVSGSEPDPGADNNTVTSVTSVSSNQPSPQPIDGPDFTGSWQSITQSCKGSGVTQKCKLKGTVVVENRGTQKADSSALRFYLSDNSAFDAGDTLLASTTTSSIKIGKAKKKKLKVTLPIGSNASGQYVIAVLDPVNSEAERNESNNAVSSGSVP